MPRIFFHFFCATFVALFLSTSSGGVYAQDDEDQDIRELQEKMNAFRDSQQEMLKNMSPEDVELQKKLQEAIASGDQAQIEELTAKLSESMQKSGSKNMKKMVGINSFFFMLFSIFESEKKFP